MQVKVQFCSVEAPGQLGTFRPKLAPYSHTTTAMHDMSALPTLS